MENTRNNIFVCSFWEGVKKAHIANSITTNTWLLSDLTGHIFRDIKKVLQKYRLVDWVIYTYISRQFPFLLKFNHLLRLLAKWAPYKHVNQSNMMCAQILYCIYVHENGTPSLLHGERSTKKCTTPWCGDEVVTTTASHAKWYGLESDVPFSLLFLFPVFSLFLYCSFSTIWIIVICWRIFYLFFPSNILLLNCYYI